MRYEKVVPAVFLSRPNRFIAKVMVEGQEEVVHVKNTGRCREILIPGCRVYLSLANDSKRKTRFDLIAVEKERPGASPLLINMDAQAPNTAAEEWVRQGGVFPHPSLVRREVTFGQSRFDLYMEEGERRAFMEVKGVTLEENGYALFPDAPTLRGVKHIEEMIRAKEAGYEAYLLFVIQMKEIRSFSPHDRMHPAFGESLRKAAANGVTVLAMDCTVSPDEMVIHRPVPIQLNRESDRGDFHGTI